MTKWLPVLACFFWLLPAFGQTNRFPPINLYAGDPTGVSCSGNAIVQSTTTGLLYTCQSGVYGTGSGGGSGTVSGQANGVIPLATGSTAIGAQSPLSVSGGVVTSSDTLNIPQLNVGSSSQLTVDSSGNLSTSGTLHTSSNITAAGNISATGTSSDVFSGNGFECNVTGATGCYVVPTVSESEYFGYGSTWGINTSGVLYLVTAGTGALAIGSNDIIPGTATLPYVGFKTYSGTGTPTDTCSSTVNTGAIEINATPVAYQCSNATGSYAWNQLGGSGSTGLSGMTAGQVPVAATASTVTSSKALAGSGTGIVTGPTSSTNTDLVSYTGTAGQTQDSGVLSTNVTQTTATPAANQICVYGSTAKTCTPTTTLPTAAVPAFTGDVTNSAGSLATTVGKVNGAAVPASTGFLASNSSSQLVAAAYTPANCTAGTTGSDCLQLSSGLVPQANIPVVNTVVDTSATVTVSTTLASEIHVNENSTAATAITYDLPTAAAGKQFCFTNGYNGSAANTGTLELLTSASGQFIIFTDGTLSATGGYVISGGAARDSACVVGVDSTHWALYVQVGTWTKH